MRYVARAFDPISASELLAALSGEYALPSRALLVTFDDGYRDFVDAALPILRRYQIPATLFVTTGFVDEQTRPYWWDELWQMVSRTARSEVVLPGLTLRLESNRAAACRNLTEWLKQLTPARRNTILAGLPEQLGVDPQRRGDVLGWSELRELSREGFVIAPHSRTHELLDQLDEPAIEVELAGSRDDIARELGICPAIFAYPNGNFDDRVMQVLARSGFQAAFTTIRGSNIWPSSHSLALRRDAPRRSLIYFALQLEQPIASLHIRGRRMPAFAEAPD
jgi:peptidoglycan/xylan/chitin deacetylase (PgdA/CDA1 family)